MIRSLLRNGAVCLAVAWPAFGADETASTPNFDQIADRLNKAPDSGLPILRRLKPDWLRQLRERGFPTQYTAQNSRQFSFIGMPVSGIGTGQLYLSGNGRLWWWDIFGTEVPKERFPVESGAAYATPPTVTGPADPKLGRPEAVFQTFRIRLKVGAQVTERLLNAEGFRDIRFEGQYPIATVVFDDPDFPVTVKLEAFSPFIPTDVADSSLPATILRYTTINKSTEPVELSIEGDLQNAVLRREGLEVFQTNTVIQGNGITFLDCSAKIPASAANQKDVVVEDWHASNYQGWTTSGVAFGTGPISRKSIPSYQGDVGGDQERVVNSHATAPGKSIAEKDGKTGTLTSKPFPVTRNFLGLWIGGGDDPQQTCVRVLVDGKPVRTVSGEKSNAMRQVFLDVREFLGQKAEIEIVDTATGEWGNIGVGRITLSDRQQSGQIEEMPDYGSMGLAVIGRDPTAFGLPQVAPPSSLKKGARVGRVGATIQLKPGEARTTNFALVWYFPNVTIPGLEGKPREYGTRFKSATDVAGYLTINFDRLASATELWRKTWYDSTLPYWFLDRTLASASTLATSTSYLLGKEGRYYAYEGAYSCPGTCTHVYLYSQAPARLFPSLERGVRENVDLGTSLDPKSGVIGFRGDYDRGFVVDGQAGTLLRIYREHLMSPDAGFLKRNWERIKLAYDPLFALDPSGTGILEGTQRNTLDQPWFGKIPWLSSLYLAAIRAGEEMAKVMNDQKFLARCHAIAEAGTREIPQQLFDGGYFVSRVDPAHLDSVNSGTGCAIDQVLGQSWAFQVGLPRVLPADETRSALGALWRNNFTTDVGPYREANPAGRWFAMPGEGGLLMCTFPRAGWQLTNASGQQQGGVFASYFNECMIGFEHQVAAHMMWEGMIDESLAIERTIQDRYDASKRNPWNEVECGSHYGRAMASYGVFLAACGFSFDGPAGVLTFDPKLGPQNFRAAFTAPEGWGSIWQRYDAAEMSAGLDLRYGMLSLGSIVIRLPSSLAATNDVQAIYNGQSIPVSKSRAGELLKIAFQPRKMKAGDSLVIRIGKIPAK